MNKVHWSDILAISVLALVVAFLVFVTWGATQSIRIQQACQSMGYTSSTAYPVLGLAYCHKAVDGTSITVPLERARWGE